MIALLLACWPVSPALAWKEHRWITQAVSSSAIVVAASDEPDHGMDRDLPESEDPKGDRKFMGGRTGPTSQGFRHMFFGGWKPWKPLTTFQYPPRSLGYAPERTQRYGEEAKAARLEAREQKLGWALHYLQDLSQPFHSVQIPALRMIPWFVVTRDGLSGLVDATTRSISNYHWAYEEYVLQLLKEGPAGPFHSCLTEPEKFADPDLRQPLSGEPLLLAYTVAHASVAIGGRVGKACMAFFGDQFRAREFDLPNHQGTPDYADLVIRPDLTAQRQELHAVTCRALSNGALASRKLIEYISGR